jgi:hypothetical protein
MFSFNDLLSDTINIQGFSHQSREKLDECHAALPHKPILVCLHDEHGGVPSSGFVGR